MIALTFFMFLNIALINMVIIWIMSAKIVTLGLLKINVFLNKGYEVITSFYDVTKKNYHLTQIILYMWSCDQDLVTLAFL